MTLTFGPPKNGWDFKGKATSETHLSDDEHGIEHHKTVYVAGPMRGYDKYNFPAFDRAAAQLQAKGWTVFNPAQMDRDIGINEDTVDLPAGFIYDALRRDFAAIVTCDALVFLPRWKESSGARAEARVGLDIGLEFFLVGPRGGLVRLTRTEVQNAVLCG